MIFDKLENFEKYVGMNSRFPKVLEFLKNNNLHDLPLGRLDICEGLFLNKQKYVGKEENAKYEYHKKFIDIQVIIGNSEKMLYSDEFIPRDIEFKGDCNVKESECSAAMSVKDGFAIFFPFELHNPGIKENDLEIEKVVFKVLADGVEL